jgi:hypothetical protein
MMFFKGPPHRSNVVVLQGLTFFLSYAILAAVLGMLQFGYNTGVINAPEVVSVAKDVQNALASLLCFEKFHSVKKNCLNTFGF